MMKKLLLIVNPMSGKNGYRNYLSDILLTFHKAGFRTTVAFTNAHGDPTIIAQESAAEYDRVVCMGGDGTLGETVSGMMLLSDIPELGYIPMGTTNDSATTLGLSQDPLQAAYTAAFGRSIPMDVGRYNGIYFSYVAAFGAFTEVSYETPQDQKNYLGRVAYYLDAMRRLSHLTHRRCRVEFDGGVLEDDFIFCAVSNSRSIAGIFRLSESDGALLSDGLFEIILIKTPESVLQLGPIITDVLANKFTSGYVTLLHSKKARFVFDDPVAWTLDGEDGGEHTEVVCENVPHAIRMMVNGER
jgi:YegS/Rv2252/BmrU family lipid kinase